MALPTPPLLIDLTKAALARREEQGGVEIRDAEGHVWVVVMPDNVNGLYDHADLFRSAPELLAALNLALEYWSHRQQRYRNRHPVWVQTARAAIAKAEGRS